MARDPKNFKNTTQLSTTVSDVVSSIAESKQAIIRKLSFHNTGTSIRTVTIYHVASGGTAGITNQTSKRAVMPDKVWNVIEIQGEVLESGSKIQAMQDAGTDINVNCSGVLIT